MERADTWTRKGVELLTEFDQRGYPHLLDRSLRLLRRAVNATPAAHPRRGERLTNLCAGLLARYQLTRDRRVLNDAVAAAREAEAGTSEDSPFHVDRLYSLGIALDQLVAVTGDRDVQAEAVNVLGRAVAAMTDEHPKLVEALRVLGLLIGLRAATGRDAADMDRAIGILRRAVALVDEAHPRYLDLLERLGLMLGLHPERTNDRRHVAERVAVFRRAVELAPVTHPAHPRYQWLLAMASRRRYEITRERAAIMEAVSLSRAALSRAPLVDAESPFYRASVLGELGSALAGRYRESGDVADLHEAVAALREATSSEPDRELWLSTLGLALVDIYVATGDLASLDEAIRFGRAAVAASSSDDPMRLTRQHLLCHMLWHRGDRTGDREALTEAINTLTLAAAEASDDHPDQLDIQMTLGATFSALYWHTGSVDALDQSVTAFQWVVDRIPDDDVKRVEHLGNLGAVRYWKYRITGEVADRDAAIDNMREATRGVGARALPAFLANLASPLIDRYNETGAGADFDQAASSARRAVALLPDDHPWRSLALIRLGEAHQARHRRDGNQADLDQALDVLHEAAVMPTAPVQSRIQAARLCGDTAITAGRPDSALAAFTIAVEQLPLLSGRQLRQSDQERQLAQQHGVASDAAACAIAAGRLDRAVELLEGGRAILHGRVLESRNDLSELHTRAPELARRFAALREELSLADSVIPTTPDDDAVGITGQLDRRHELAREWADLVETIRTEHGNAGLFRPPRIADLLPAAADGPIVIVNVSQYRCDALVLATAGVRSIPLPELASVPLEERSVEFMRAIEAACGDAKTAEREAAEHAIEATIGWLRSTVTQPIMDALDSPVPRIWWSPTSVLSFLPLHAAVLDDTVSSYTPTVSALLRARAHVRPRRSRRGLIVALPHTPGHARLAHVTRERDLLTELFPASIVLRGPAATRASVLRELSTHPWVHLACHGRNDIDQPSCSNIQLWDGPLSVRDLFGLDTNRGDLAFLTACETAQGGTLLADEALHIGGAFHLAGYTHVIATLWPAHDATSAELTESFYRQLRGSPETGPEPAGSATALHIAAHELRNRYPTRPSRWATYVHYGP